eukprot:2603614-Amphidinium_carterae.1
MNLEVHGARAPTVAEIEGSTNFLDPSPADGCGEYRRVFMCPQTATQPSVAIARKLSNHTLLERWTQNCE